MGYVVSPKSFCGAFYKKRQLYLSFKEEQKLYEVRIELRKACAQVEYCVSFA